MMKGRTRNSVAATQVSLFLAFDPERRYFLR